MNLFLWYPKCSTCKKALEHLQKLNIPVTLRDIKEKNPTIEELKRWWNKIYPMIIFSWVIRIGLFINMPLLASKCSCSFSVIVGNISFKFNSL